MNSEEKWLYFVELSQPFGFYLQLEARLGMSTEAVKFRITGNSPPCDARIEFLPTIEGLYKLSELSTETIQTLDGPYTMPNRVLTRLTGGRRESFNTHNIPVRLLKNKHEQVQYFLGLNLSKKEYGIIEVTDPSQIITAAEIGVLDPNDFFELGCEFGTTKREADSERLLHLLSTSDLEEHKEQFEMGYQLGVNETLLENSEL